MSRLDERDFEDVVRGNVFKRPHKSEIRSWWRKIDFHTPPRRHSNADIYAANWIWRTQFWIFLPWNLLSRAQCHLILPLHFFSPFVGAHLCIFSRHTIVNDSNRREKSISNVRFSNPIGKLLSSSGKFRIFCVPSKYRTICQREHLHLRQN